MSNQSRDKSGHPTPTASGGDIGRTLKTAGYVTLAVILTIFLLRNSQSVEVDFVFASLEVPLFLVLLATLILGAVLALGASGLRRRRRRKVQSGKTGGKAERPEAAPTPQQPPGDPAP